MKPDSYYKRKGLVGLEAYIPENSGLVGRTVVEIEGEYHIVFDHFHDGAITPKNRFEPRPDYNLEPNKGFHAWGNLGHIGMFIGALNRKKT